MNSPASKSTGLVVISGATSGIGEATSYKLSEQKIYTLLLLGRNKTKLLEISNTCKQLGCPDVHYIPGDLRNLSSINEISDFCKQFSPIKALVNSAGLGYFGPTFRFSNTAVDEIISVNLMATFYLCRDIGSIMAKQNHIGTIINISSDADYFGFKEAAVYCASKGGVLAMSRALRLELQPLGIRVTVISPGRVDTHFNNKKPGMRTGALKAHEVAETIEFAISCSSNIEVQEIRLDSMERC